MVNSMMSFPFRYMYISLPSRVVMSILLISIAFIAGSAYAAGQWCNYQDYFEAYLEPRIPAEFYLGERILEAKLSAAISFNQNGEPVRIRFGHVIEEGGLAIDDPLWPAMERSARRAIEQWRVKPRLWSSEEVPDSTERAFMNAKPHLRPDRGFQFHLVVFVFVRGISDYDIRTIGVVNVNTPEER